jgi:hypothetical protein
MIKKTGATEERLGDLHDKYTGILEYLLENAAYRDSVDEMGEESIVVNAKVLDLVAKHLKDNNITAVATLENATGHLAQAMQKRQAKKRFGASVHELKPLTKEAVNE